VYRVWEYKSLYPRAYVQRQIQKGGGGAAPFSPQNYFFSKCFFAYKTRTVHYASAINDNRADTLSSDLLLKRSGSATVYASGYNVDFLSAEARLFASKSALSIRAELKAKRVVQF